jgi:hypothetical protein
MARYVCALSIVDLSPKLLARTPIEIEIEIVYSEPAN